MTRKDLYSDQWLAFYGVCDPSLTDALRYVSKLSEKYPVFSIFVEGGF